MTVPCLGLPGLSPHPPADPGTGNLGLPRGSHLGPARPLGSRVPGQTQSQSGLGSSRGGKRGPGENDLFCTCDKSKTMVAKGRWVQERSLVKRQRPRLRRRVSQQ